MATVSAARRAVNSFALRPFPARGFRTSTRLAQEQVRKTGLYDFHVENGAKMVPFAGYSMPLSYGSVGTSERYFLTFLF